MVWLSLIGVGGMGSVYRARDLHFPSVTKLVAVKEMINQAPDPLIRATIVQNFEREATILATLSHPSIPRIYDYFSEDNRSYLVLEFIHGNDLEKIINDTQGFLPEEQVLAALHANGFQLLRFEDPVRFRYAYENSFRQKWDRQEETELVVVLPPAAVVVVLVLDFELPPPHAAARLLNAPTVPSAEPPMPMTSRFLKRLRPGPVILP